MHNFAPVLVITLNRYEHFKRCIESLAECTHAEKTDLYIALDYPLNESHWDGYKKISNYIEEIKGFKTVVIIRRSDNFGALKNHFEAQEEIFKRYDRIIFSEDDNEFSPNFLDYINKGLEKFEDDENVLAVCGYNFPIEIPKKLQGNYFHYRSLSAWGFGTWKHRYPNSIYPPKVLTLFMNKWKNAKKVYQRNLRNFNTILNYIKCNKSIFGDMGIGFYLSCNENINCVFPTITKVINHGHDGSGVNCGKLSNNKFLKQTKDPDILFEFSAKADFKITKRIKKYFSNSWRNFIISLLLYAQFKKNLR